MKRTEEAPARQDDCLSCFVQEPKRLKPATVCVRWGSYHWPLCDAHSKIAKRNYPTSRVVRIHKCRLCMSGLTSTD